MAEPAPHPSLTERTVEPLPDHQVAAAVDLGSNSFHLIIADTAKGRLQVLDRMREMVQLGAGLDGNNRLTIESSERALACLRRFGERLRGMPRDAVRAVGTNTLRKARNSRDFLGAAVHALGHEIDIISGHEEARLIYLGVAHSIEDESDRRLVIDIGGGSTELILGERFRPELLESLHMGSISMSHRFFADGQISASAMAAARLESARQFELIERAFRGVGWDRVLGASGTIRAIRAVLREMDVCRDGISAEGLRLLEAELVRRGTVDALRWDSLRRERAPIFAGGVAILASAFDALGLEGMRVADGALREGLLYDLMGRLEASDVRDRTVADLVERLAVDLAQGERVAATAEHFFDQVADAWEMNDPGNRKMLGWAARLHEAGLWISHSQYHKHGAYLLTHLDMPGFARFEQELLAKLVRCHRRKFAVEEINGLPEQRVKTATRLALLLRLAVVLHRSRSDKEPLRVTLTAKDASLRLTFPDGWLLANSLAQADLDEESDFVKSAGFKLKVR